MYTIGEVKEKSRRTLKKNYWRILGISLIVAFLASGLRVDIYIGNAAEYIAGGRFEYTTNTEIVRDVSKSMMSTDAEDTILSFVGDKYTPQKGIFAKVYNRMTADKSFMYGFLNAMNDMLFKDRIGQGVIILTGAILLVIFLFSVSNIFIVGQCRFMMETITYRNSRIDRLLFIWRVNRWKKTAYTMMFRSIYTYLWDITIIGGIVKRYSYKMMPYILAENPDLDRKEVFRISRDMMNGNKMRAFVLDLSLMGWYILGIITLGIVKIMVVNPYRDAIYAHFYQELRETAIAEKKDYAEAFNDRLLFVENSFNEYPVDMHPLYDPRTSSWIRLDYHKNYSLQSYILMFFTFSFIGWLWEVSLHLFGDGVFVNRGFYHGPLLPIYGTGGVLVVFLLKRFSERPMLTFALSVLVCGVVEYSVAWFLWETQKEYWWNYSGYFLNLHGRICAEGLVVFGIGGLGFIYILAPLFDAIYMKIRPDIRKLLCILLIVIFLFDTGYSLMKPNKGEGITDYHSPKIEKYYGK